jgi:esterase/lipase superfamily enzyme
VPAPAPPVAQKVTYAADMFFAPGSAVLRPEALARLDGVVERVRGLMLEAVIVVGHTDTAGSEASRRALSLQRAEAVRAYLVSKGIENNRIYTEGKGGAQPLADNRTAEGRGRNNRAELEAIGTVIVDADWKPDDTVPVFFATNRQRTGNETPFYYYDNQPIDQSHKEPLRHGVAVVKVPPDRQRGAVARPSWVRVTLNRVLTSAGLDAPPPADLRTQFSYVQGIRELDEPAFSKELSEAIGSTTSKTAVLYVHGYANDFTDGVFRAAQIAYDLAAPGYTLVPIAFSWPSNAGTTGYSYAQARNRAQVSGYDLADFLKEIAAHTNLGTVHLVAHSMGAEVLGHALIKLGVTQLGMSRDDREVRPVFRQIVFAAPDITPRIFEEVIEPAIRTHHMITAYGTPKDLALWTSTMKNRQTRVGRMLPEDRPPECVDMVDVTAVAKTGIAHSTWAESGRVLDDLRLLLKDAVAPARRGLVGRASPTPGAVWVMPAQPSPASTVGHAAIQTAIPAPPRCALPEHTAVGGG